MGSRLSSTLRMNPKSSPYVTASPAPLHSADMVCEGSSTKLSGSEMRKMQSGILAGDFAILRPITNHANG